MSEFDLQACLPWIAAVALLATCITWLLSSGLRRRGPGGDGARDHEPAERSPDDVRLQRQQTLFQLLELENMTVEDIMIPRSEVKGIDLDHDLADIVEQLRQSTHTRQPVYHGELNQVAGIVHMRRLASLLTRNALTKESLLACCVAPYFVLEGTPLATQLINFRKEKRRLGLVVDEYGDVRGLVTLEDLLDEIVGDFNDQGDGDNPDLQTQPDGTRIIDGAASIREINKALNWHLPSDGPKTLNGLITEALETIPDCPVCLRIGPYRLEILESSENRVTRVRAWHSALRRTQR